MINQDKQAVRNAIVEIDNAMTRIDAERDHIKTIVNDCAEKHAIDKKTLRAMARLYHKQSIEDAKANAAEIFETYEQVFLQTAK